MHNIKLWCHFLGMIDRQDAVESFDPIKFLFSVRKPTNYYQSCQMLMPQTTACSRGITKPLFISCLKKMSCCFCAKKLQAQCGTLHFNSPHSIRKCEKCMKHNTIRLFSRLPSRAPQSQGCNHPDPEHLTSGGAGILMSLSGTELQTCSSGRKFIY